MSYLWKTGSVSNDNGGLVCFFFFCADVDTRYIAALQCPVLLCLYPVVQHYVCDMQFSYKPLWH